MPKAPQPATQKYAGKLYAGCSGWAYPTWKPEFYPPGLPAKQFLEHYAARLNSVEVNYTFRRIPSAPTVDGWLKQTGAGFRFSFKAPQRMTHTRRLKDCAEILEVFYAALRPIIGQERMGVVLFQLPPNFKADIALLDTFLQAARRAAGAARIAFEFRHDSWFVDEVYHTLREHGAALCEAESDDGSTPKIATANFSCDRLRKSAYSESSISTIARQLEKDLTRGDVFAYFKHEDTPDGAFHAEAILREVKRDIVRNPEGK